MLHAHLQYAATPLKYTYTQTHTPHTGIHRRCEMNAQPHPCWPNGLKYSYFQHKYVACQPHHRILSQIDWLQTEFWIKVYWLSTSRIVNNTRKHGIIYWLIGFSLNGVDCLCSTVLCRAMWPLYKHVKLTQLLTITQTHTYPSIHLNLDSLSPQQRPATTSSVSVWVRAQTWIYLRRH